MQNEQSQERNLKSIIKEEDLQQLNQEAESIVKRMNGEEAQALDGVIEQISNIGEKEQSDAGKTLEILKRPVNNMIEGKNNNIPKTLLELRAQVEELNPDNGTKGIKGILNKITGKTPLKSYVRKYQSSQTHIDAIVSSLYKGRDQLQEDNVELGIIKKQAQDKIYELEKQMHLARRLLEKLEEESKKPEWADKQTQLDKARVKLSVRTKNMATTINVLIQSIASIDTIIDTNEKLEESVFNAVTLTKNIATISVAIQVALTNQKKVIEAVRTVNKTTEDMLLSNAKLLKQNTEETTKQLEEPSIALDKLRQAFNDVHAAIKTTEESNKRIIVNSKAFIQDIDKLNAEMKEKLE